MIERRTRFSGPSAQTPRATFSARFAFALLGLWSCRTRPTAPDPVDAQPAAVGPVGSKLATAYALLTPDLQGLARSEMAARASRTPTPVRSGSDTPLYANRLLRESSPYLRAHALEPVDWHPWGEEAFTRAAREGKPLFLSVGFLGCHFCDKLSAESFSDVTIAEALARDYIAVLVDREEHPEVDRRFMPVLEQYSDEPGWPMNVWLTAKAAPYFACSYVASRRQGKEPGLLELLSEKKVQDASKGLTESSGNDAATNPDGASPESEVPIDGWESAASQVIGSRFDGVWGGYKGAPKFPLALPYSWLLRVAGSAPPLKAQPPSGQSPKAARSEVHATPIAPREIATMTLDKILRSATYDQAAGGIHRYAGDGQWRRPHFEKELVDNALFASALLDASVANPDGGFSDAARHVLAFIDRDLRGRRGLDRDLAMTGLAADAIERTHAHSNSVDDAAVSKDGSAVEGASYTWTAADWGELSEVERGPFKLGAMRNGRASLELPTQGALFTRPAAAAKNADVFYVHTRDRLLERRALYAWSPEPDAQSVVAYNALWARALLQANAQLGNEDFAERAQQVLAAVEAQHGHGAALQRVVADGHATIPANLDDYARLLAATLDAFENFGDAHFLLSAKELEISVTELFEDPKNGGYFSTRRSGPGSVAASVAATEKVFVDTNEPSGNGLMFGNLSRLARLTGEGAYATRAAHLLQSARLTLQRHPEQCGTLLIALRANIRADVEVVVLTSAGASYQVARAEGAAVRRMLAQAMSRPHTLVISTPANALANSAWIPALAGKKAIGGKRTIYVCSATHCEAPSNSLEPLERVLAAVK